MYYWVTVDSANAVIHCGMYNGQPDAALLASTGWRELTVEQYQRILALGMVATFDGVTVAEPAVTNGG